MHERAWLLGNPILRILLPLIVGFMIIGITLEGWPNGIELAAVLLPLALLGALGLIRLEVRRLDNGLRVGMLPFWRRTIPFTEIESARALRYRPMRDFGGWGIRFGLNAVAYTVYGADAVYLKLSEHRNVVFGSVDPDIWLAELQSAGIQIAPPQDTSDATSE